MRRALVAICAVGLVAAAKPEAAASPPDANGWSVAERQGTCILFSQAKLAFLAIDGTHVAMVTPGAIGGPKTFTVDGGSVVANFKADGGLVMAAAPDALLVSLLQTKRVKADWPDLTIDTAPPTMASLTQLRTCGARVANAKAEAQAKAEQRRRIFQGIARGLAAAGAAASASEREDFVPAPGAGGGVCFKQREWTSGFNKNCVYDCTGSEAVQTISSMAFCPLTINR